MGRLMAFIDGENLVMRYQDMVKDGSKPRQVQYLQDVYVWHPQTLIVEPHLVIRATYYTYATGSDEKIAEIEDAIGQFGFQSFVAGQRVKALWPKVFKKPKKSAKAKGVDIQMTVDILTHTYQNNIDAIYLMSGDGDYIPVIDEARRMGKEVYIRAFSSGLNPKLKTAADEFTLLDDIYFESQGMNL